MTNSITPTVGSEVSIIVGDTTETATITKVSKNLRTVTVKRAGSDKEEVFTSRKHTDFVRKGENLYSGTRMTLGAPALAKSA